MKYLFYVVNGIGIGHLCRMIGVAEVLRSLDPAVQILFITEVDYTRLLREYKFAYFYIPPKHRLLEDEEYRGIAKEDLVEIRKSMFDSIIKLFRPDVIVHDTLTDQLLFDLAEGIHARHVLILRLQKDTKDYVSKNEILLNKMERIVLPYNRDTAVCISALSNLRDKLYFSGPLLRRTISQVDVNTILKKYGIADSTFKLVISNGGGTELFGYQDSFWDIVSKALTDLQEAIVGITVIVVTGPLNITELREKFTIKESIQFIQFEPNLLDLFASAHLVIARGGYNTVLELSEIGVPAICIPAYRKSDDQYARVNTASNTYLNIQECELTRESICKSILKVLKEPRWSFKMPIRDLIKENKKKLGEILLCL